MTEEDSREYERRWRRRWLPLLSPEEMEEYVDMKIKLGDAVTKFYDRRELTQDQIDEAKAYLKKPEVIALMKEESKRLNTFHSKSYIELEEAANSSNTKEE